MMFTTQTDANQASLHPALDDARRFLAHFAPEGAAHCFQTFDDRKQEGRLACAIRGPLDQVSQQLAELNGRGAGVFFTVNEVAAGQRRTAENVVRVRALFVDADEPARLRDVEAAILRLGLPPSIVVESSPGKRHFYWLMGDCPLDRFKGAQRAIIAALGTDPAVCDLPRVMRMPGFFHRKSAPFLVRVVVA